MKKPMMRTLALGALTVAVLLTSGCGGNPTSGSSKTVSSTVIADEIADFGGRTVKIMSTWDTDPRVQAEDLRQSNYQDQITRWNQIEKEYNCKISVTVDANTYSNFVTAFNSGDAGCDIVCTSLSYTYPTYMVNGLLEPLDDYVNIYGTKSRPSVFMKDFSDMYSYNGKHYAVKKQEDIFPAYVIFYNKRIFDSTDALKKYDLNQLVNDKKWTWDIFRQVAKDATFDTAEGQHITGVASQGLSGELLVPMLVASNGGQFIERQDGKDVSAFAQPAFTEAKEFANQLVADKSLGSTGAFKSWTGSVDEFKNGHVAMFVSDYWRISDYHEALKNDKFGILPAPIGPRLKDYNNYQPDASYYAIVKGAKEPAKLGKLLEALNQPLASDEQAQMDTLEKNVYDEQSLDVLRMLKKKTSIQFYTGYASVIKYLMFSDWGLSTNTPPATFITSVKSLVDADMANSWVPKSKS